MGIMTGLWGLFIVMKIMSNLNDFYLFIKLKNLFQIYLLNIFKKNKYEQ